MVSSYFRFDVFFQLWQRAVKSLPGRFDTIANKYLDTILQRRHRDIARIFDDVNDDLSSNEPNSTHTQLCEQRKERKERSSNDRMFERLVDSRAVIFDYCSSSLLRHPD